MPWQQLEARIEPHYPNGRRAHALSVMLRVHLVQLCYNLSDPWDGGSVVRSGVGAAVCGRALSEPLPDESTSCISATCWRGIAEINGSMAAQGGAVTGGNIVDATIIAGRPLPRTGAGSGTRKCVR